MSALSWFPQPRRLIPVLLRRLMLPRCPSPASLLPPPHPPPFPKDSSRQPRRSREALTDLTMVISAALGPGIARIFYYPTLFYTLVRARLPGSQRPWFNRIDRAVVLGALPLRGRCRQLIEQENIRGVLTMNEEYETRFLCCSPEEWEAMGVEQMRLSTVDLTGIPSLENLQKGVKFVLKHRECGNSVYVHCKAGRCRSATMVAAYLIQVHHWTPQEAIEVIAKIRPHIIVRRKQLELLEDFHKAVTDENPAQSQQKPTDTKQQLPQNKQRDRKSLEDIQDSPLKTSGS